MTWWFICCWRTLNYSSFSSVCHYLRNEMINHDKSPSIALFISPSVYQKYIPKQLLVFSHIDYRTFEVFISFPICGSLFSLSRSVSPSIKVSEIKFSHSSLLRKGNKMKESAPLWYSCSSRLLFMQIWSHPCLKRRSCKLWKCVKSAQQNIDILISIFTKSRFFSSPTIFAA